MGMEFVEYTPAKRNSYNYSITKGNGSCSHAASENERYRKIGA